MQQRRCDDPAPYGAGEEFSWETLMSYGNGRIFCIFRNDDFCALSDHVNERRILEIFEKYSVPQVIAVTPNVVDDPHDHRLNRYHPLDENGQMVELIKEFHAKGLIDIAQHGFTHQTNIHHPTRTDKTTETGYHGIDRHWLPFSPANGEYSEFKGLSYEQKKSKILKGKECLERLFRTTIETFIFPWNTFDRESLEILKECGIKNVLAGNTDFYHVQNLNILYNCREDFWDEGVFLNEIKKSQRPKLVHLLYHSWLLSGEEIRKLDSLLRNLSAHTRVEFLKAGQIGKMAPFIQKIRDFNHAACRLGAVADPHLVRRVSPPYYIFDKWDYLKRIVRGLAVVIIVKGIGLRRAFYLTACMLLLFIVYERYARRGLVDIPALLLFFAAFAVMAFLNLGTGRRLGTYQ